MQVFFYPSLETFPAKVYCEKCAVNGRPCGYNKPAGLPYCFTFALRLPTRCVEQLPSVGFGEVTSLGTPRAPGGPAAADLLYKMQKFALIFWLGRTGYYITNEASQCRSAVNQRIKFNTVINGLFTKAKICF